MESIHAPRNRKERRAQKKETASAIAFTQPSRDPSNHKTLLDIASERQLLDKSPSTTQPSIKTTTINPDGSLATISESEETPYLDIALYAISLTLLHFTFTILVHHQYATEPPSLLGLLYTSTVASPTPLLLLILVALLHPRASSLPMQVLFAALSLVAGGWLVHTSNMDGYLAAMKKAPPLGTLWVWAVVEMRWEVALSCLGAVAGWGWWNGYSFI